MRQILLFAAILASSVAVAQTPRRANVPTETITIVSADQLQSLLKNAPASPTRKAGDLSTQLFPGAASCSFIRLSEPDLPHVHPVSEIYVIQEGSGELETDGTMIGPFFNGGVHNLPANGAAPREPEVIGPDHGGQSLEGGKKHVVTAGDVIVVPAGVNHHWTRVDKPIVYLDIKFPKVEQR